MEVSKVCILSKVVCVNRTSLIIEEEERYSWLFSFMGASIDIKVERGLKEKFQCLVLGSVGNFLYIYYILFIFAKTLLYFCCGYLVWLLECIFCHQLNSNFLSNPVCLVYFFPLALTSLARKKMKIEFYFKWVKVWRKYFKIRTYEI